MFTLPSDKTVIHQNHAKGKEAKEIMEKQQIKKFH